jgi:hypothetical protein
MIKKTIYACAALCVTAAVAYFWALYSRTTEAAGLVVPAQGEAVSVAPVLRFRAGSEIEIPMDFQNNSDKPFRYLLGYKAFASDGGGPWDLKISLWKDGRPIPYEPTIKPPTASPERVREVKPGQAVRVPLRIYRFFSRRLTAGKYEVVARYDIRPSSSDVEELGLTPLSFERKIAYLEIDEDPKR